MMLISVAGKVGEDHYRLILAGKVGLEQKASLTEAFYWFRSILAGYFPACLEILIYWVPRSWYRPCYKSD